MRLETLLTCWCRRSSAIPVCMYTTYSQTSLFAYASNMMSTNIVSPAASGHLLRSAPAWRGVCLTRFFIADCTD
jgi:hypothetical protein